MRAPASGLPVLAATRNVTQVQPCQVLHEVRGQRTTNRFQHGPPARTLNNAAMSASVPTSPSPLKSAVLVHGRGGQLLRGGDDLTGVRR